MKRIETAWGAMKLSEMQYSTNKQKCKKQWVINITETPCSESTVSAHLKLKRQQQKAYWGYDIFKTFFHRLIRSRL